MDGGAAPEPPVERLRIERRGGLAGLRPSADCAYASMSAGQRSALREVLAACSPLPPAAGADRFSYRLQVVHVGGTERTLDVPEDAMPQALARLVRPGVP